MVNLRDFIRGDEERRRFTTLTGGGLLGLALFISALIFAVKWSDTIFGGLEAWQGSNWWQLWVCALLMFGGLIVMFTSLQAARAVERFNPFMRRLLYGYNAVLTGLLVLAILLVLNVLVYNYLNASFDWTGEGLYTLSERSKNVLKALDKPTKIYVLAPRSDDLLNEIRTLLTNCQAVTPQIQVEYLSPDLDIEKVRELSTRYQVNERRGILVVYGSEGKTDHQFIKENELFEAPTPGNRKVGFVFKGEDALISALNFLEEGKTRSIVYFTQGNSELELTDREVTPESHGMGELRERLQKGNYEVKGLQFSSVAGVKPKDPSVVVSAKVPEDAEVVVLAGPRTPLPDLAVKALRDYMNPPPGSKKKGKLIVLLDPVLTVDKTLVKTGLEGFLAEFNVQVGNDRVLSLPTNLNRGNPLSAVTRAAPRSANPVARTFALQPVVMPNVRSIQPQAGGTNPAANSYRADTLLQTFPGTAWTDTNFKADPIQLVEGLTDQELANKLSGEPVSVAVVVAETQFSAPGDPHAFMRGQDEKPRLAVFGGSPFASNPYMTESRGNLYYVLFASTLAWLRERPSNIGLEPKKRNQFELTVADDVLARMRWLPAIITFCAIIGLGTGVWLIRRR
jgi:hypothetical protein